MLTAEKFDAAEAYRIGLVRDIAPAEELDGKVNETLGALMLTSTDAVREAKRLMREVAGRPIDEPSSPTPPSASPRSAPPTTAAKACAPSSRSASRAGSPNTKPRSPRPRATTRRCERARKAFATD